MVTSPTCSFSSLEEATVVSMRLRVMDMVIPSPLRRTVMETTVPSSPLIMAEISVTVRSWADSPSTWMITSPT